MRRLAPWFVLMLVPTVGSQTSSSGPSLTEIVADPQTDWDGDGRVTSSDEFVELRGGDVDIDLTGWSLWLNDTTPVRWNLAGVLPAGGWRTFVNPPGDLNNNAHVALLDPEGRTVDEVRFGSWPGAGATPDANAASALDEALWRSATGWWRGHATPGFEGERPQLRASWPFPLRDGVWWTPGSNANWTLEANWVDSEARVAGARLRTVSSLFEAELASSGRGMGKARATLAVGGGDVGWELVAADGTAWGWPSVVVRLDETPPVPPTVEAPQWSTGSFEARVPPTTDAGVGGVEYLLETSVDGENWTRASNWSAAPPHAKFEAPIHLRASARDAFGHNATGPARWIGRDARPPEPILAHLDGTAHARLAWAAATDEGSGVASVIVRREGVGANRTWTLPGNATTFVDESLRPGDEPLYWLHAVDHAGNAGTAQRAAGEWAGAHPRAQVRLNHAQWGARGLRIWVDFDRPMDVARPVEVEVAGLLREGRWLANASTWSIVMGAPETGRDGPAAVRVLHAVDPKGRGMLGPVEVPLVVDGTPPLLEVGLVDGWTNATGLRLAARDALDPAPRVRHRSGNASQWEESASAVLLPVTHGTRIEAYALDAAGGRSPTTSRTVKVDAEPPWARVVGVERGRWGVRVGDNASGLGTVTLHHEAGATALVVEGETRWVDRPGNFTLRMLDRVGNERTLRGHLPADVPGRVALEVVKERPQPPAGPRAEPPATAPAPMGGVASLAAAGFALLRRRPDAS